MSKLNEQTRQETLAEIIAKLAEVRKFSDSLTQKYPEYTNSFAILLSRLAEADKVLETNQNEELPPIIEQLICLLILIIHILRDIARFVQCSTSKIADRLTVLANSIENECESSDDAIDQIREAINIINNLTNPAFDSFKLVANLALLAAIEILESDSSDKTKRITRKDAGQVINGFAEIVRGNGNLVAGAIKVLSDLVRQLIDFLEKE